MMRSNVQSGKVGKSLGWSVRRPVGDRGYECPSVFSGKQLARASVGGGPASAISVANPPAIYRDG